MNTEILATHYNHGPSSLDASRLNRRGNLPTRFAPWLSLALALLPSFGPWPAAAQLIQADEIGRVPGYKVTAVTLRNELFGVNEIEFDTAPQLSEAAPGEQYNLRTIPSRAPFTQIRSLIYRDQRVRWHASAADQMETMYLGKVDQAVPPAPNWRRDYGAGKGWSTATPAAVGLTEPLLGHAQASWAPPTAGDPDNRGVYLFRQSFEVGDVAQIVRATLRVAGRVGFEEIALNDLPVHRAGVSSFGIGEFEVTPLIRSGANIVAVKALAESAGPLNARWISFHLEIERIEADLARKSDWRDKALVETLGGDRVRGEVREAGGEGIAIETPYGSFAAPWAYVQRVLFPAGLLPRVAAAEGKKKSRWWPSWSRKKAQVFVASGMGLPVAYFPAWEARLSGLVLLTRGRTTQTRPTGFDGTYLELVDTRGEKSSAVGDSVVAIYPEAEGVAISRKPNDRVAALFAEVTTVRGDIVSGLLRQIGKRRLVLEAGGRDFLRIPIADLVRVDFPTHRFDAASASGAAPIKVGLLAQSSGGASHAEDYFTLSAAFQEAAFHAGAECDIVGQDEVIDAGLLSPATYPVLASLDPLGEYPDSLLEEEDARRTLEQYVKTGGTLVLYSRGGALRTAVINGRNRFIRTVREDGLLSLLGFEILQPGGRSSGPWHPFDRPPNTPEGLAFERQAVPHEHLLGLPPSLDLATARSGQFYPMVPTQAASQIIYELRDEADRSLGPALSVTPVGKGRVIVIDHLLWSAKAEGDDFARSALPIILSWALED